MVKRDLSQGYDNPQIFQEPQFFPHIGTAPLKLLGRRLVVRRSAAHRRADVAIRQNQTIVLMPGGRLIGEPKLVEGGIQPVTAPVTRENAPGSVAAMSGGSQTEDIEACRGIAETGDRPTPVNPVAILPPFFLGDRLSIGHEAGTGRARGDALIEDCERLHRGGV